MAQKVRGKMRRIRRTSIERNNGGRSKEGPQKIPEMKITRNRKSSQLLVERFRFHPQKHNQLF